MIASGIAPSSRITPAAIARDLTALRVDHHFQPTFRQERLSQPINRCHVHSDCIEVDELIFEIADYKSDYVDLAAEKLLRKCTTSGKPTNSAGPRARPLDS